MKTHGNVRVQVTEADIAKAEVNSSMRCVVAQAIARTMPDATRIDVDVQTVRWSQAGERKVYLTPYSVAGYVIAFDAGDPIEPFTFVLRSDRRVPVKSGNRKTEAGKEIGKAEQRVRAQRRKVEQLELVSKGEIAPPPTKAERQLAKERLPEHEEKLTELASAAESVRAAYVGATQHEKRQGEGRSNAPKRVVKSSERHYGMRKLRVNRPAPE